MNVQICLEMYVALGVLTMHTSMVLWLPMLMFLSAPLKAWGQWHVDARARLHVCIVHIFVSFLYERVCISRRYMCVWYMHFCMSKLGQLVCSSVVVEH